MRIDIRWPSVAALAVTLGSVAWVMTRLPVAFWEHVDWTVAGPALVAIVTGIVQAFLGRAAKRTVAPRDSTLPPPVPAAEAKRRHAATLRGEEPTTAPRQPRASELDVTQDGERDGD